MIDALRIAASGLQASSQALSVAASNIVSATGLVSPVSQPNPPQAPAGLQGLAAAPTVDLATQMVSQMQAADGFRANLAVYRTASKMYQTLLDAGG